MHTHEIFREFPIPVPSVGEKMGKDPITASRAALTDCMEVEPENRLQYCALVPQHYMQCLQKQPILTLLSGRIVCLWIVACILPYYQHCRALITAPVVVVPPPWDKGSGFLYSAQTHKKKAILILLLVLSQQTTCVLYMYCC
jgi:hypothetical protein